jgi:hypothetical protein
MQIEQAGDAGKCNAVIQAKFKVSSVHGASPWACLQSSAKRLAAVVLWLSSCIERTPGTATGMLHYCCTGEIKSESSGVFAVDSVFSSTWGGVTNRWSIMPGWRNVTQSHMLRQDFSYKGSRPADCATLHGQQCTVTAVALLSAGPVATALSHQPLGISQPHSSATTWPDITAHLTGYMLAMNEQLTCF